MARLYRDRRAAAKAQLSFASQPPAVPSARLPQAIAQSGRHVRAELLEEPRLIVAGRVEDEVAEAELDIVANSLDDLVGLGRDDEARGRAVGGRVGEPPHLERILDAHLLLRRQRERRPPAAGGPR